MAAETRTRCEAAAMTITNPTEPRRPWHLWVLGIVGLLWGALGAFDYAMTMTRNPDYMGQFPQEMVDYWYGLPWWYFAIWGVGLGGGVLGSFALLLKSRWAAPLLALALLSTLFSLVCAFDPAAPKMEGMAWAWLFAAAITAFAILMFAYAVVQRRRGLLT
jgi:hypothetical protein